MFDALHVICAWHVGIVITAGSLYTARPTAYLYTTDLVALQACNSAQVPQLEFTESAIRTPLFHDAWVAALSSHPDRNFVTYICTGLRDGFRIGFARTAPLRSASANMFSAVQHPEIIDEYIDEYISKELGYWLPIAITSTGLVSSRKVTTRENGASSLTYPTHLGTALTMV